MAVIKILRDDVEEVKSLQSPGVELVSCPVHMCPPVRNGLVKKSNFLGLFSKKW